MSIGNGKRIAALLVALCALCACAACSHTPVSGGSSGGAPASTDNGEIDMTYMPGTTEIDLGEIVT
ncbi:MAG: hypothetical protein IKX98_02710, partial [Clostridia bacterium]|nr:hypothetical protein [Clostridia bacterium]